MSQTDQVVGSVFAAIIVCAVVAGFVLVPWWGKLLVVGAVPFGAWAMRAVRRLPWGEARGQELRPIQGALLVSVLGGLRFGFPVEAAASMGVLGGMTVYSYGCNIRSGRLRLFGIWPRP